MTTAVKLEFGILLLCFSIGTITAGSDTSSREEIKKKTLDTFGFEIFEQKLPGLEGGYHRVRVAAIVEKFGKPVKANSIMRDYRDPSPKGPLQYEEQVWYYDGLVLQMRTSITSADSQANREAWIERVTISNSSYALANGLRIGQPVSVFVDTLGEPTSRSNYQLMYDVDNEVEVEPHMLEVTPYQISMKINSDGNVSAIEWTWWWH